jgi:2',3'-cyclic-nucleotide 2'-phosphodiesterase (5'-nucleotidase family)
MSYWDWFWTHTYYSMLFGGTVVVIYLFGHVVWRFLSDWSENRAEKKHFQTLRDK